MDEKMPLTTTELKQRLRQTIAFNKFLARPRLRCWFSLLCLSWDTVVNFCRSNSDSRAIRPAPLMLSR